MESAYRTLSKNPRESASWISILTFAWTIPMFKRSYHNELNANDVFDPVTEDRSDRLGDRLERYGICEIMLILYFHFQWTTLGIGSQNKRNATHRYCVHYSKHFGAN